MDCDHLSALQIVAAVPGLSHRQLNYWTTRGLVDGHRHRRIGTVEQMAQRLPLDSGGSGAPIYYNEDVIESLRLVAALVTQRSLEDHFRLARDGEIELGAGITLTVTRRPVLGSALASSGQAGNEVALGLQ